MAHVIKFKRGQADQVDAHVPQAGEPVFDLERKELRVGDGAKIGGHHIGRVIALDSKTVNLGTSIIDEIPDSDARGAVWFYTVSRNNYLDMRPGKIQACWDELPNGVVVPLEEFGADVGETLGVVSFTVEKSGHIVQLRCTVTNNGWLVDANRMTIGR